MTYIIDAVRTPIGNFGGTLKEVRTDDLGAIPIRELLKKTGLCYITIINQNNIEIAHFKGTVYRTKKEWFPNN